MYEIPGSVLDGLGRLSFCCGSEDHGVNDEVTIFHQCRYRRHCPCRGRRNSLPSILPYRANSPMAHPRIEAPISPVAASLPLKIVRGFRIDKGLDCVGGHCPARIFLEHRDIFRVHSERGRNKNCTRMERPTQWVRSAISLFY